MLIFVWKDFFCWMVVANLVVNSLLTSTDTPADNPTGRKLASMNEKKEDKICSDKVCDSPYSDFQLLCKNTRDQGEIETRFNCSSENLRLYFCTMQQRPNSEPWYQKYKIIIAMTASALFVSAVIVITVIIVVVCKRRARKRRQKREDNTAVHNQTGEEPLTMSPSPAYSEMRVAKIGKMTKVAPKPPPKPQLSTFCSEPKPLCSFTESDHPQHTVCTCTHCKSTRVQQAGGGGKSPLYPDEKELAEAIVATLRRFPAKPRTLNINMFRSRRFSRSVPDLFKLDSRSRTLRRGFEIEEEELEEEDEDEVFGVQTARRQHEKRGRRKTETRKMTRDPTTESMLPPPPSPHVCVSSSDPYPRYSESTNFHIRTDDSSTGSGVIEVSSTCTRESTQSGEYMSMNLQRGQALFTRDRISSARSPVMPEPPPPCGTSKSRIYENLRVDPYITTPIDMIQGLCPRPFSYTALPLSMTLSRMGAPSSADENRGPRRSHESTIVRIAVRKE